MSARNTEPLIRICGPGQTFCRLDGPGYTVLAFSARSAHGPRGLALLLGTDGTPDITEAVRDAQARHFTRHLFPWRAISWVYRAPSGNYRDLIVRAWRDGDLDLGHRPARNADVSDFARFAERAGYCVTPAVRSEIERALKEAGSEVRMRARVAASAEMAHV
jgi:hypothetical protein